MPAPEQEVGVAFPSKGLDVTCEYGRQPAATAPDGVNVRTNDPIARRDRGGSRVGLVRHIDERVNSLSPVQHVNFLVDPQAGALNADTDNQLPGYIPDPSTSNTFPRGTGRYVPDGGGGSPPNRNIPSSGQQTAGYLRQSKTASLGYSGESSPFAISFDQPPLLQSLVVAIGMSSYDFHASGIPGVAALSLSDVRNSANNSYTQLGSRMAATRPFALGIAAAAYDCAVWYKYASAGSPDQTVRFMEPVTKPDGVYIGLMILEFVGYAGGPVDTSNADGTGGTCSPGAVLMSNTVNELVFFASANQHDSGQSVAPAFTRLTRLAVDDENYLTFAYKTGLQLPTITPTMMPPTIETYPWSALGVCFNHS